MDHLVVVAVAELEERLHFLARVAVYALDILGGEPHRYDAWRDVREIEVEAILLITPLLLRDQCPGNLTHDMQISSAALVMWGSPRTSSHGATPQRSADA